MRIIPLLMFLFTFIGGIVLKNKVFLVFFIGLVINGVIWAILNPILQIHFPQISQRPQSYHCYYIETGEKTSTGGLPSGHSQSMGFVCTFLILLAYKHIHSNPMFFLITFISMSLIYLMMYSRTEIYRCHTWLQAQIGTLIGMISALIIYVWIELYKFL